MPPQHFFCALYWAPVDGSHVVWLSLILLLLTTPAQIACQILATTCEPSTGAQYRAQKKCCKWYANISTHLYTCHHSMCIVRVLVRAMPLPSIHAKTNSFDISYFAASALRRTYTRAPRMIPVSSGGTSIAMMPDSDGGGRGNVLDALGFFKCLHAAGFHGKSRVEEKSSHFLIDAALLRRNSEYLLSKISVNTQVDNSITAIKLLRSLSSSLGYISVNSSDTRVSLFSFLYRVTHRDG